MSNPVGDSDQIVSKVEAIVESELARKLPDWGRVLKQILIQCNVSKIDAYRLLRSYRKNGRQVYPPGLTVTSCIILVSLATDVWMLVNEITGSTSHRLEPCIIQGVCLCTILLVAFLQRRGV